MASLTIMEGQHAGTYFQLANRPLSAGRDPSRDIQIPDAKVSRKHFLIRREGENYELAPCKSLNGVAINGVKHEDPMVLREGDLIKVGDTILQFSHEEDPDRTNALQRYKDASRRMREAQTMEESRSRPS